MTPTEAVKFLSEAAWKQHTAVCKSLPKQDEAKCNCGASQHNATVRQALIVLGTAGRKQK